MIKKIDGSSDSFTHIEEQSGQIPENVARRRLLSGIVASGSALVMSGLLRQAEASEPLAVPKWTKSLGEPVSARPYGLPSPFEKAVIRRESPAEFSPPGYVPPLSTSSWSLTPLQDLHGSITPNGLFFERHHGGLPTIDPAQHRLVIHGLVKREILFSMEDLIRFPAVSKFHFLECSGNSDTSLEGNHGQTAQDIHGLVSCAQWTGVMLSTLLREAGIDTDKARYILAEGADGAAMLRTIPISRAMDDCMIVYAQNGERLRPEQGYPIRLLVPGCEGNINVKWLRRLEVSDIPAFSREETSKYTDLTGPDGIAHKSSLFMEAKSLITFPSGEHELPEAGHYEIRGIAWSGRGKITGVDVSVDGGKNWQPANLAEPVLAKCLTSFTLPWRWNKSPATLISRARDETGYVQPYLEQLFKVRGKFFVYHNNAMQPWRIDSNGKVTNGNKG
jgi:sulfane dehydrogenase subunit SoxC